MAVTDAAPSPTPTPTQRRVLAALKRHGEATADELAGTLEISPSAVRQHLSTLRAAGLIEARREHGHTGRPADRYHATERTEPLFVSADDLSIELLELVDDEHPELVDRVFDRRRRQLVDDAEVRLAGAAIEERIARVTELLDAQGYLCDWEQICPTTTSGSTCTAAPSGASPAASARPVRANSSSCRACSPTQSSPG
jgi:DeoR family transcriptional regulator, suf operon transcriptional repressor